MRQWLPTQVLVAFVATRIALVVAGLAAPLFIAGQAGGQIGAPPLSMWTHWDGQFYIDIARLGYFVNESNPPAAFFPLYPLLLQLVTLWSPLKPTVALAGVIVSNAALLALLAYVVALARLDFDEGVGRRAAIYYLVAPTTLFLSAVYAESLFLVLLVASFYHARRGQLALAGGLGFLAALTRPYGVLLVVPIAWEALRRRRLPVAAIGPLLGPPVYFAWLWLQFGDPLAWFSAQAAWKRQLDLPWRGFMRYIELHLQGWFTPPDLAKVDLLAAVALLVLGVLALWKLPRIYGVFGALMVLALLMASHLQSMTRWALSVFPIFFLLALWGRNRFVNYAITGVSFAIALYLMMRFSQWNWVA